MNNTEFPGKILIVILKVIMVFFISAITFVMGVRRGQITALNGNIMYELVEQRNGEITWELITK